MPVSFSIADSSDGPRKVVIWVTGMLDVDSGRAIAARLAQAERQANSDVIVDMTGVTDVEHVALSMIGSAAIALLEVARLRIVSPPDSVAQMFLDAGLNQTFELTMDRRGLREDRRKQDIPVAFDRRKGDRRHAAEGPTANGHERLPLDAASARSSAG